MPTIANVIPAIDLMDEELGTKSRDTSKYDFAIWTALGLARKTLNKYYEQTDNSEIYRIAMGEHYSVLST